MHVANFDIRQMLLNLWHSSIQQQVNILQDSKYNEESISPLRGSRSSTGACLATFLSSGDHLFHAQSVHPVRTLGVSHAAPRPIRTRLLSTIPPAAVIQSCDLENVCQIRKDGQLRI